MQLHRAINMYGRSRNRRHTVNPGEEAQTLVPCVLKIAALSKCPVPTKLLKLASMPEIVENDVICEDTSYQHMLEW